MKVLLLVFLVLLLLADCNGLFALRSKTLSRTTPSFSTPAAKSLPQATLAIHGHSVAVHNRITSSGISQSKLSSSVDNEVNTSSDTVTFINKATNAFPLWVAASALLGVYKPATFKWFLPYITPALTLTMASMGMTLTVNDFQRVGKSWKNVLIGFMCQYTIMPLSAYYIAKSLSLGPELATGLLLVGCSPGGTASNLVSMIAKADLALSILMTTVSTVAAVVMTPFLVTRLAGNIVAVKSADLIWSTLNVVLLPVLIGLRVNTKHPKFTKAVSCYTPLLSVLLVAIICGSIASSNSALILNSLTATATATATGTGIAFRKLALAVFLLHSVGFSIGYLFSKFFSKDELTARTISIETGMQNSALAAVLASHFPNPVLTALPSALSATCHSILGSSLATWWRRKSRIASAPASVPAPVPVPMETVAAISSEEVTSPVPISTKRFYGLSKPQRGMNIPVVDANTDADTNTDTDTQKDASFGNNSGKPSRFYGISTPYWK